MIRRVYFGNWLRDYSQALDVGTLKTVPKDTIRCLVWVLAFLSFGYATGEYEVTEDRLGVYRPEEHIGLFPINPSVNPPPPTKQTGTAFWLWIGLGFSDDGAVCQTTPRTMPTTRTRRDTTAGCAPLCTRRSCRWIPSRG